mgnify:CR=1 FL=1|jgi:DNA-binding GntR family transcriptional regulator|nr:GntR family transcriptional regulator [uncultured Oscillibacter sp.]
MDGVEQSPPVINKAEYVYQTLRKQILNGTYAPGTMLYIRELSTRLNVSRTPVKEAISRLSYEGYVELLPNRCAIVARISATEILELLELREALESASAFYAAQRRTDEDIAEMVRINDYHKTINLDSVEEMAHCDRLFHMSVAKATYNRVFFSTLDSAFERLTRISLPITRDRAQVSIVQHQLILEAIRAGNASDARRLMKDHDRDVLESVKMYQFQNIHLFK